MTAPTEGESPEEWADAVQAATLGIDESPPTEGGDARGKRLLGTADAVVWADEFMAMVHEGVPIDWMLMVSWFANAIETGRAAGHHPTEVEA